MPRIRLYVGNLPYQHCNDVAIREIFTGYKIVDIAVISDRETRRPRGFCFVELEDEAQARKLVEVFEGATIDGRTLRVSIADEKPQRRNNADPPSRGKGGRRRYDD